MGPRNSKPLRGFISEGESDRGGRMTRHLAGVGLILAMAGCAAGSPAGGGPAPDAGGADACAAGALCDGRTGLCQTPPVCTAAVPCPDGLVGLNRMPLTEPITLPECRTHSGGRPVFDDGPPRTWTDAVNGQQRAACVFKPPGTSMTSPRPLLVFLHGSGGSAVAIYDNTSLRAKAATLDLGGGAGFILAADQGRNLPPVANGNPASSRHEIYDRNFATSPDVRNLDRLIDTLVSEGGVDPKRIYLTGWSNGAFFSQLYALIRHQSPTPGGNRIAAVAVFDGADPFEAPTSQTSSCAYRPYPTSSLPVFIAHRACSIVPCDATQAAAQGAAPGYDVQGWLALLRSTIGATDVTELLLASNGSVASTCAASCSQVDATLAHVRWPDGVADGSGIDREPQMLGYLAAHPLP